MLCNEDGKVYHKNMNELLKLEAHFVMATARSTWDIVPLHDVIDAEVEAAEARLKDLEIQFSNLSLAIGGFQRRWVDGQEHITSML